MNLPTAWLLEITNKECVIYVSILWASYGHLYHVDAPYMQH